MEEQKHHPPTKESGQALVEYVLIVVLVVLSFSIALAATGPAIGNVFSNTILNLLGQTAAERAIVSIPDRSGFWGTVTWVAGVTPQETPFATVTSLPPTLTFTPGPSPTPAPPTATFTPSPTFTPSQTPTPIDKRFIIPLTDVANDAQLENWRLDNRSSLGTEDWHGTYFPSNNFSGTSMMAFNRDIDPNKVQNLNWSWAGSPFPGNPSASRDQFSVVFRRPILIPAGSNRTLTFSLSSTNGALRVWAIPAPDNTNLLTADYGSCTSRTERYSGSGMSRNNTPGTSQLTGNSGDGWQVYGDITAGTPPPLPQECVIADRWQITNDNDDKNGNVQRTFAPGRYLIIVDFVHNTSGGRVAGLSVDISGNTPVNTNDVGSCNWGNPSSLRSDTVTQYWDANRTLGELAANSTCYLELRGFIFIDPAQTDVKLTYWDVWDLRSGGRAWVEVAEYIDANSDSIPDSPPVWVQVPTSLKQNDSFNYNWTYNMIDLSSFAGKNLAIRFAVSRNSSPGPMRYWLDTISFTRLNYGTYYTSQNFDFLNNSEISNFITSGRWGIESYFGNPALHESLNSNTERNDVARTNGDTGNGNVRMHSVEFNGFVDLDDIRGATDTEGDQGDALVSFSLGYALGTKVGFEVQYSTTPYGAPAVWQLAPQGDILSRTQTATNPIVSGGLQDFVVRLEDIPVRRFRLRFVVTVATDSNLGSSTGLYLDNIRLEREGRKRFLQYPYADDAETADTLLRNYSLSGGWGRVNIGYNPAVGQTGNSYNESPGVDANGVGNRYVSSSINSLTFKDIFDVYNDTLDNPFSPVCNLGAACESVRNPNPVTPNFSFWHRRLLGSSAIITVEWKLASENNTAWRIAWRYNNQPVVSAPGTPSTDLSRARFNLGWERITVDFRPILSQLDVLNPNSRTNTNREDDDINIRIRFLPSSGGTNDGLFIDELRVEEASALQYALWTGGTAGVNGDGTPVRNGATTVFGNGTSYVDSFEGNWFDTWSIGGFWTPVTWESSDSLRSFHDSVTQTGVVAAPNYTNDQGTSGPVPVDSFNIMESETVIDLRGTNASDRPIMYFWTRWYGGGPNYFSLQISAEQPSNTSTAATCGSGIPQCYENSFGWGPWTTVWTRNNSRNYSWTRHQIDLSTYAKNGANNGNRIRIRFVSDELDNSGTTRDGMFIDNISFTYNRPNLRVISKLVANGGFGDASRNMENWVAEGGWGLSSTMFSQGGGDPASLGAAWNFNIWNEARVRAATNNCNGTSQWRDCASRFLNLFAASTQSWSSGAALAISSNWGSGGPTNPSGTTSNTNSAPLTQVTENFVIRWTLDTPAGLPPGRYTFITASDDGVRLRYDTIPAGNLPPATADDPAIYSNTYLPNYRFNIIENWQDQGRTTTISSARIESSRQYRFTMEYYERNSDASIQLSLGSFRFSFTSQIPRGTGRTQADQIPTLLNGNSSLIYKGAFDLRQATNPRLSFNNYYELSGSAFVEVSTDGGFTWTTSGLAGTTPPNNIWATNWWGYYWNDVAANPDNRLDSRNSPTWAYNTVTFNSQPVTIFPGSPLTRDEGTSINYSWGGSPLAGIGADNFSVRFVRKINVAGTYTISVTGDDGYRLWTNYTSGCGRVNGNNTLGIFSGVRNWNQTDAVNSNGTAAAGSCLMIDRWVDQGETTRTVVRSLPAGAVLMLDYYENGGGAMIRVDIAQGNFNSPQITDSTYTPDDGPWQRRVYDLTSYAGPNTPPVMLRFRYDRTERSSTSVDSNNTGGATFNYQNAWWITDVEIIDP
jgi:hypothetical protein